MTRAERAAPAAPRHAARKQEVGRHRGAPTASAGILSAAGTAMSLALLLTVGCFALALVVVPKLTGSVPLTVLTGSMEPTYPPGTVVIVRPTPFDELRIGDAVTYQIESGKAAVVTHRIVGVTTATTGERSFITQGDNNSAADPDPVVAGQVRGKVWYDVPLVGYASTWLSGDNRTLTVNVLAGGLIAYGACLAIAGATERRRRQPVAL